ncbi:Aminomethyltransferase [Streptomyces griseoloalbus]
MTDGEERPRCHAVSGRPTDEQYRTPLRTALDALHRSLGATMTDFAGWDMPLRYGSERDEHNAVRTRAGLFDLSHMGEITVTGPGPPRSSTSRWWATSPA